MRKVEKILPTMRSETGRVLRRDMSKQIKLKKCVPQDKKNKLVNVFLFKYWRVVLLNIY